MTESGPLGGARQRTSNSRLVESTLQGIFWTSGSTAVMMVLQLVVLAILARLITPAEFGVVSAALVITAFSDFFSNVGMGPAVVQRKVLESRHAQTAFASSISLGVLVAAIVWIVAEPAARLLRIEEAEPVIRALAWLFPLKGVSVVAEGLARRELRFSLLAGVEVLSYGLGYGVIGVSTALAGWGVWALVAGQYGQTLVRSAALLSLFRPTRRPLPDRQSFRELSVFGAGISLGTMGSFLGRQGDNLVIARWLGAGALGVYGRAFQLADRPSGFLAQIVNRVLFPLLSRVQNQKERLAQAYTRGLVGVGILMMPTSVVLIILGPQLVHVVLGDGWTEAILPFRTLAGGMLMRSAVKVSDSVVKATGFVYRRAWRQWFYALSVFVGVWVGQHWGINGAAFGVVGAQSLNMILMTHLGIRSAEIGWSRVVAAFYPGARLATALGLVTLATVTTLDQLKVEPFTVLAGAMSVGAITFVLLTRFLPRFFLGDDGIWIFAAIRASIGGRFSLPNRGE